MAWLLPLGFPLGFSFRFIRLIFQLEFGSTSALLRLFSSALHHLHIGSTMDHRLDLNIRRTSPLSCINETNFSQFYLMTESKHCDLACTKTRNNETKRPKRNHRNERNETTETSKIIRKYMKKLKNYGLDLCRVTTAA